MRAITPQLIEHAIARQIEHFEQLIRHARALGFEDDVRHWESEKASYIAEMSGPEHTNGSQS